ncbi:MAG: putative nucleotidyltransferase substrate binding domain-containing protein [Pseudomonadota bacterium]
MVTELIAIEEFLGRYPPFDTLEDAALSDLARQIEIRYARHNDTILASGERNQHLFVVRSGAVELRLFGETLSARLGEGTSFAYPSLLRGGEVHNTVIALEDTLLYAIPAERFHVLRESVPAFHQFFAADEAERIKHALSERKQGSSFVLENTQAKDLVGRGEPVTCNPATSIREAVGLMHHRDVSTLMICEDAKLIGIFTDKDLRNRVFASELDLGLPISEAMTHGPRTLSTNSSAAEAMAMMTGGGFRHIPLIDGKGALSGVLSATDILSAIGNNAIDTGMAIASARTGDELIEAAGQVPSSFATMVAGGMHAQQAMRLISAMGEAVHRKAAQIAQAELGEPPCPYALVVFGSLARQEQLVGSDQDNGLIIDDAMKPGDKAYFEALGTRISDLLDASGYVYCKGGIMAKNAEQRRTLSAWCERYEGFVQRVDENRILRATIFFDMRHVFGDASLTAKLSEKASALYANSPLFVSYLARDALRAKIPLGIFRNLVLETAEDGEKVFDAKKQAIMPIIDIARTHALAAGLTEVGTIERLDALASAGKINRDDAQSLEDALLLVNEMRIAHQARQVERGEAPDNLIAPSDLSSLERDYLKNAFSVVRQALDALRRNFAGGIA